MPTTFYEILTSDLPAHRDHFKACHQMNKPGNELAVIENVAGDKCLVKVNCDEASAYICGDCPIIATYDLDGARALLQTPEWKHEGTI